MALPLSTKILLALGTVGTVVYGLNRREAQRKKRRKKASTAKPPVERTRDPSCLFKIYGEGGQVIGDSERIFGDLHEDLQTDEVRNTAVDMEPDYAEATYEYMLHLVANEGMDVLGSPAVRDEAIKRAMKLVASACDWSDGLGPYTYGSPFQKVWTGAGTLAELAQTNLEAKEIIGGGA